MSFHYCFTVYLLIEVENGKMLIGKNTVRGKWWNFLWNFLIFTSQKVFPEEVSPGNVCQKCPNDKISTNNFQITSRLLEELFSRKGEKGKDQGDKFSFHCEETLTLTKIKSRDN